MNILLIPEVSVSGGTGTFLKQLINIHKKAGIDTKIILPESLSQTSFVNYIENLGFDIHLIPDGHSYEYINYLSIALITYCKCILKISRFVSEKPYKN